MNRYPDLPPVVVHFVNQTCALWANREEIPVLTLCRGESFSKARDVCSARREVVRVLANSIVQRRHFDGKQYGPWQFGLVEHVQDGETGWQAISRPHIAGLLNCEQSTITRILSARKERHGGSDDQN
jgi:hypothetical protein